METEGITLAHAPGWHRSLLIALVECAARVATPDALSSCTLEIMVDALGATSGFVALKATDEDSGHLTPSAMAGPHAALVGGSSGFDLAADTPVATVFREGTPHYVEGVYDTENSEAAQGVARWREALSAQATAVLPIEIHGERLGVFALEWSSAQTFDESTRELLETATALLALGLSRAQLVRAAMPGPLTTAPSTAQAPTLRFELTAEGVVIPRRSHEPWGEGRVRIAIESSRSTAAVLDVHAVSPGRVLVLVGDLHGLEQPQESEIPQMLRHTARALATRLEIDDIATMLETRAREHGGLATELSAWVALWDSASGSLTHTGMGDFTARLLMADGRDLLWNETGSQTWLPLPSEVVHAWVPGAVSTRMEWV